MALREQFEKETGLSADRKADVYELLDIESKYSEWLEAKVPRWMPMQFAQLVNGKRYQWLNTLSGYSDDYYKQGIGYWSEQDNCFLQYGDGSEGYNFIATHWMLLPEVERLSNVDEDTTAVIVEIEQLKELEAFTKDLMQDCNELREDLKDTITLLESIKTVVMFDPRESSATNVRHLERKIEAKTKLLTRIGDKYE